MFWFKDIVSRLAPVSSLATGCGKMYIENSIKTKFQDWASLYESPSGRSSLIPHLPNRHRAGQPSLPTFLPSHISARPPRRASSISLPFSKLRSPYVIRFPLLSPSLCAGSSGPRWVRRPHLPFSPPYCPFSPVCTSLPRYRSCRPAPRGRPPPPPLRLPSLLRTVK
ncbi:hypothetical protein C7M84_023103 [Penaeus vannamei]|uniref:Uncharacterized protein n=1 Tax=Penaeus vannamei TaxID=6689 RepID=A0A3R7MIR7_PENVA|nr:hypothetical protein C7M84_023103 [Penaeus vannamei]